MPRPSLPVRYLGPLLAVMLSACVDQLSEPQSPQVSASDLVQVTGGVPYVLLGHTPPSGLPIPSRGQAPAGADIGILATTTFVRFVRSPAEGGGWVEFPVGGFSYFRDVAVATEAVQKADANGDYWDADMVLPSGGVVTWPRITYYSSFGGETDCFVSGFQSLCGATEIYTSYILGVQCQTGGTYTSRLYQNGGQVFTGSFVLKPTLPPGAITPQLQTSYPDEPYNTLCVDATDSRKSVNCGGDTTLTKRTIKQKGCALTAVTMLLGYFGVTTDPKALNDYLLGLPGTKGYLPDGGLNWLGVLERAGQESETLQVEINDKATPQGLRNRICRFGPQVVEVKSLNPGGGKHFVVVTGLTDNESDFTIADPADPSRHTLAENYGTFNSVREFEPRSQPTFQEVVQATLHSPAELVITDPLGRRTGLNSSTGRTYAEIPNSVYDSTGLGTLLDDGSIVQEDPLWKELHIYSPPDGRYTVAVTGTATGRYTLNLRGYDGAGRSSGFLAAEVPISRDETHQYTLTFSGADMSAGTLAMAGGFNGGGQRSAVNALLSYARPGQSRTSLPPGSTAYSLMLFYDTAIDASTFAAELNGLSVAAVFHPVPGGSEVVNIPLAVGRNVLKLSVTGNPAGRTGSDRDQLTFVVP